MTAPLSLVTEHLPKLETIGIKLGYLPSLPPFSTTYTLPDDPLKPKQYLSLSKISNTELLSSLEHQAAFDDLYVHVANRAIDMYTKALRPKFTLKLRGSLAALDVWVFFSKSSNCLLRVHSSKTSRPPLGGC